MSRRGIRRDVGVVGVLFGDGDSDDCGDFDGLREMFRPLLVWVVLIEVSCFPTGMLVSMVVALVHFGDGKSVKDALVAVECREAVSSSSLLLEFGDQTDKY